MNHDLDCTICLSVCVEAVESQCCGGRLYCSKCANQIKECPICRTTAFVFGSSHFARRMIRCHIDVCPKCGTNVGESEVANHLKLNCPKRKAVCVAKDCLFEGLGEDILEHLNKDHAPYLIALATGVAQEDIFRKSSANVAVQTVNSSANVAIQTDSKSAESGELVGRF